MFTWKQTTHGPVLNGLGQRHLLWPWTLILKNNQEENREDEREGFIRSNDVLRAPAG